MVAVDVAAFVAVVVDGAVVVVDAVVVTVVGGAVVGGEAAAVDVAAEEAMAGVVVGAVVPVLILPVSVVGCTACCTPPAAAGTAAAAPGKSLAGRNTPRTGPAPGPADSGLHTHHTDLPQCHGHTRPPTAVSHGDAGWATAEVRGFLRERIASAPWKGTMVFLPLLRSH